MGLIKPRLNTSDATATATDIFPGKTAYVAGEKLVGVATEDATATAANILSGATAYAKGAKLTGTMVPDDLDSLTADATAAATDISIGATAYVKGAKVTGTLPAFYTAIQAPTVYPTDGSGNFGIYPPYDLRMMPGSFLFHSAADVGAVPENIVAGKTILGVAGNVKSLPSTILYSLYNGSPSYDLTSVDEQKFYSSFSGTPSLAIIITNNYNGTPVRLMLRPGESGVLSSRTAPTFQLRSDDLYYVHNPALGYREKGTLNNTTVVVFGDA